MSTEYLKNISAPQDIKKLNEQQLNELSEEIRGVLINTVSLNGGHLSSNLGVVELTVAIHRSFDSPHDKIVWDVGHQIYTHKLLTGRYSGFDTLRKEGGLSGFSRPCESEHDIFYSGHSSTSIASAYGLSIAEAINNCSGYVVAVIGDGAFTGGLVYEAMNNVGRNKNSHLIVVLNDNEMSISKNVGSIAKYLAVIRSKKSYSRMKARTERLLNHIPLVGKWASQKMFNLKTFVKNILYNSTLFEDMGFRYMGPVDGHNIKQLCEAFEVAKEINTPVLLHVRTSKGKGYRFAERSPSEFHGVGSFNPESGERLCSGTNFSEEFGKNLCALASEDNRICAITAAMSLGTGLTEFCNRFRNRFFDVGIAEDYAVTFASGLSKGGELPVFVVYSTFLQRCYDQLIHDAALQRQKMVIAIDRAGFVGEDGETHQGIFDVAFLSSISDVTIYAPATYDELKRSLNAALYTDSNVVAIRYPKGREPAFPADFEHSVGSYSVYGDLNAETFIVTYGRISANACTAVNVLRSQGKNVCLLKLNRIKPIDSEAVSLLLGAKSIFFFEEGVRDGGVGEKFALLLLEGGYMGKYKLTAVDYCFVEQGSVCSLLKRFKLDCDGMTEVVSFGESKA